MVENKRVCVIGAGASGLSAAKNLLEAGIAPLVLERGSSVGGLWVYTDNIGKDEFGLPVHSSMYKNLWTNLPKETMQMPGLEYDRKMNSFLPASEVVKYFQEYAKKFDIFKCIKFNHFVENVKRRDNLWEVTYKNLLTGEEFISEFDFVMMCIGHYSVPFYPKLEGLDSFKGEVTHSHDYKSPEKFSGKAVCVQGAGPSGIDLALELTKVCKKVLFSHHLKEKPKMQYPPNMQHKPDISRFDGNRVRFTDGSEDAIDAMLFCTGYLYDFPMLDANCGITVKDNHVRPLYKHLVNIEHPSMCLVGIPFTGIVMPMFDVQTRYYVEYVRGNLRLPGKEEMYAHTEAYYEELREEEGYEERHFHMLGKRQQLYYDSLSDEAKIARVPPVLAKMHHENGKMLRSDIKSMRKHNYTVIDDENFVRHAIVE